MSDHLTDLFERFRDRNDLRALARVFDATAPELASVAAHMAKTAEEAEDLLQATFLSAIERSASFDSSRPVVPWLVGILAVHARKQRERAGREIDTLRVRQPGEIDPSREVEREEISRAVESAVLQLGPNYAPLVRRHLIDGATPRVLAREFEMSPIAARVRLHRGLKKLRLLLPVGLSMSALGVIARQIDLAAVRGSVLRRASQITGAPIPVASLATRALGIALLAPVALAIPAWLLWRAPDASVAAVETFLVPAATTEMRAESAEPMAEARELAEAAEPAPEPTAPSALQSGAAIVRGRLLLPSGAPAVGAVIGLEGSLASQELAEESGPVTWTNPAPGASDENGVFELSFDPPPSFQFFFHATDANCATANWRWNHVPPGPIELGDVQLEACGALVVHIVDGQGATLSTGWTVRADTPGPTTLNGRDGSRANARPIEGSTTFTLERLPARRVNLSASSLNFAAIDERIVDVVAGANTEVELVYRGPDLSRRIAVRVQNKPLWIFTPSADHIWLTRPGAEAVHANPSKTRMSTFVFDGVEAGVHELRIDDPRFEPWSQGNVVPGDVVRASVTGNAAVHVTITGANQMPYTGSYRLSWNRFGTSSLEHSYSNQILVSSHDTPPPDGLVRGLVPGYYEFEIRIAGHAAERVVVEGLLAGETREIAVALGWASGIVGRVLANAGSSPMAGVDVQLTRGTVAGHTLGGGQTMRTGNAEVPAITTRASTDANGEFHFDDLQPGTWSVRTQWSRWLVADRTIELPTETPLEIVQPSFGYFVGQLLIPAGAPIEDTVLQVIAHRPDGTRTPQFDFAMERDPSELANDGSFHFGPLPTGEIRVAVVVFTDIGDDGREGIGPSSGTFEIAEGIPQTHEIDVRSNFPARIHGLVSIDGVPAAQGSVRILAIDSSFHSFSGHGLTLEGRFIFGGIAPHVSQCLSYMSPAGWSWASEPLLLLEPGTDTDHSMSITTIEREVQIVDNATSLPLSNLSIELHTGPECASLPVSPYSPPHPTVVFDAAGKLLLRMPSGPANFRPLPSGTLTPAMVEWTPGSAPIVLRYGQ
ncbi:MAG TPA: sigma-70 family RNA polymerase sigma factor [Planctomycetota bacterium]|nr:sigma-70 family RNA polymerase sigma factor [Planctomycetota bacterium]